ncbi:MAG: AMIN domain-containing protein [Deltaproteobacteria bacterium]|nr:AMIN domain-containing protein [Deltaproteobacteria bacterium]
MAINVVEKIEFKETEQAFLTIVCSEKVSDYTSFYLKDPSRFVVDVKDARLSERIGRRISLNHLDMISIRTGDHKEYARVVLDLKGATKPDLMVHQEENVICVAETPCNEAHNGILLLGDSNEIILEDREGPIPEEKGTHGESERKVKLEGDLEVKYSGDISEDDQLENLHDARSLFTSTIKYLLSPQNFIKAGIRVRYIEEWDNSRYSFTKVTLGEAYLNLVQGDFYASCGNQIVRWGSTDEISPIDVINPEDLTELFINRRAERKLPAPMVRLGWLNEIMNIEVIYLPVFLDSDVEYFDSDWSLFPHFPDRIAEVSPAAIGSVMKEIRLEEKKVGRKLENGEGGVRLTKSLSNLDIGFSFFYGWEDIPQPTPRTESGKSIMQILFGPQQAGQIFSKLTAPLTSNDLILDLEYNRFSLYGLDFATTWRDLAIRGELAYFKERHFLRTRDLSIVSEEVFQGVIGVDYNISDDWYVNCLYSYERIFSDEDLIGTERSNENLIGSVIWDIKKDQFTFGLYSFYSLTDKSFYLNPSFVWDMGDHLRWEIGANLIWSGCGAALFPYKDNDNIYVELNFCF